MNQKTISNRIPVTDFEAPELDIYARMNEIQLLNRHEPEKGMFIAESPKVIERAINAGYQPQSFLVDDEHMEADAYRILERCKEIPVYAASREVLRNLTGFPMTRGMLCAMHRLPLLRPETLLADARRVVIFGTRGESDECRGNFPQRCSIEYGCGTSDTGLQRSVIPQGDQGQYGNGFSDSVDIYSGQ